MGVVVLGPHRSGTSALTRAVGLCGLHHGDPDRLIGATEHNPGGHWEVEDLTDFDEQLLLDLGGKWSAPPRVTREQLEQLARGPEGEKAKALHAAVFDETDWVWKDPRLCLLLPFWVPLFAEHPVIVAAVRNPLEVADSLRRRNGFSIPYALALWERYQRLAVEFAHGLPNTVVDYSKLVADPEREVLRLADFLTSQGLGARPDTEAVRRFVTAEHRHSRFDVGDLSAEQGVTPSQRQLYELLVSREVLPDPSELPPETPGLQLAFDEHKRMSRWHDEALQLRNGVDELRELHDRALAELERLGRWLEESRRDASEAWANVRRLEEENRDLHEIRRMLLDELEAVISERDRLRAEVEDACSSRTVRAAIALRRRLHTLRRLLGR